MENEDLDTGPYKIISGPIEVKPVAPQGPGKGYGQYRVIPQAETTSPVIKREYKEPVGLEQYQKMSPSELAEAAKSAAPKEAEQYVDFAKSAVTDPRQFFSQMKDLGYNLGAKAAGELGVELSPETKETSEKTWQAVSEPYKEYFRPGGFKKAIATRPISVAMDIAAPFTLGSSALARTLPTTAKVLGGIGTVLDPVQAAVATAKKVGQVGMSAQRAILSGTSRTPRAALEWSSNVLDGTNIAQKSAFWGGITGNLSADDIKNAAVSALQKEQEANIKALKANKNLLALDSPGSITDFNNIDNAVQELRSRYVNAAGTSLFPEAERAVNNIDTLLQQYKQSPNLQTLDELDKLRSSLWNMRQTVGDPEAQKVFGRMYHEVKSAIDKATGSTAYSDIMDNARANIDRVKEITQAFGLRAGAGSAVSRMLNKQRSGRGVTLLQQLAKHDANLPYMLAGDAGRELVPQDIWHSTIIASGGIGALAKPELWPVIASGVAASSPMVATGANVLLGGIGNLAKKATSYPVQKAGYLTMLSNLPSQELTPSEQQDVISQMKPIIASVESAGSGGYTAVGPKFTHQIQGRPYEDQALGKYQVLKSNLPEWTKKYLGRELTPEQFLKDQNAQEKVFEGAFGELVRRYGNVKDATSAWHSGAPLAQAQKRNAKDVLGTKTEDYVSQVMSQLPPEVTDRLTRKTGGRVGGNVDSLVDDLMGKFRKAKKETDKTTEPLLNAPDEHIVKALDVAQQAI